MLIEAAKRWPDLKDEALDLARQAGDITWRKGLRRKGKGLCHGIAGN